MPITSERVSSPRPSSAIAIFARLPVPGRTKTRLIPLLGRSGAAGFQAALIADAVRKVDALAAQRDGVAPYLFIAEPAGSAVPARSARQTRTIVLQRGADLGARLDHAFQMLLRRNHTVIVIGTDSPLLAPRILRAALRELRLCDAVLGPCPDGGYYLVGLRARALAVLARRRSPRRRVTGPTSKAATGLFDGVRWGSRFAFRDTLRNLLARGLSCSILEPADDVDRPGDLRRLAGKLAQDRVARRVAPATWRFLEGRSGLGKAGRRGLRSVTRESLRG